MPGQLDKHQILITCLRTQKIMIGSEENSTCENLIITNALVFTLGYEMEKTNTQIIMTYS